MGSPASLATLGGAKASPSGAMDCCTSSLIQGRIRVVSRISYSHCLLSRRWPQGICKCMARTDLIEKGSLESTFRGSSNSISGGSSSKDEDADLVLKPAPKPVLNTRPSVLVEPANSLPWSPAKLIPDDGLEKTLEDREKVIESLGEVLEKVEKLETASSVKLNSGVSRNDGKLNSSPRIGRPENSSPVIWKSKTLKSVWRKGNPVANVEKVVKEVQKVDKDREVGSSPASVAEARKLEASPRPPLRPQPPPTAAPNLQAKPVVISTQPPPAANRPVDRKPILVDKFAPKKPVVDPLIELAISTQPPPAANRPVDRKPILVDKFAPKKPVVDPLIEQAVLTPVKPGKGPPPSKAKEERRKKSNSAGSLRRRVVEDDIEIPEEDASELNVSIPGAAAARRGRKWSKASRKAARLKAAKDSAPIKVEILEVGEEGMLTEDLAYNLAISETEILNYLFMKGVKPDSVQTLNKDMVKMICKEYEVEVIEADEVKAEQMAKKKEMLDHQDLVMLEDRPPIVTIMGHVDHGKTTLLDYIRKSKVVASEAGGITQGIGAYKVEVPVDGKLAPCVFLDTPGHEAFAAMRARGTRVTDIAIIVVAADDGVRPQTNEAIAHAKAAGVPIVVAINKIDKNGANPDRAMQELSSVGLMPEDWGGDVPMVQISALNGENVDALLETVMLVAELQELKANPHRNAKGTVIEAGLHKSKGPMATFVVQNGTLKTGDVVICGEAFGKVRALFDDRGKCVDDAGPSMAVQVIGLNNVPIAGDEFEVVDSLDIARERTDACAESLRAARISAKAGEGKVTLSSIASAVSARNQSGLDLHQLNIILKVDVQGSIEAIRHAIQVLPQDNVTLKFLLQAPGDVITSDIDLAVAAEAIIFGFNVKASGSVKSYADKKNVEIRLYRVIYDLIDDLRNAMEGLLEPVEEQISVGAAGVRKVFNSGSGRVAGCMVTDGKVSKDCGVRVIRKGKTIFTGTLDSLRRVKEEVKEVNAGLECGVGIDDYIDWEVGDIVEAFDSVKRRRTLEEASATVTAALAGAGVDV